MHSTLELVLILLTATVLLVALFRGLRLPALLAYLLVGILTGPHTLGWVPESGEASYLAEFGVVFLMFSIGLEFSLQQLKTMRHKVFGLGGAQVGVTLALVLAVAMALGLSWQAGVALGGIIAMSSTAIVSRLLAERVELHSAHGRQIIGVLLFQDLAVVPLLILIPAFAAHQENLGMELALALGKALAVLWVLLYLGQKLVRPWFHQVARHKSSELFMLNVLFVTLGLAYLTEKAGLSLALGAFLAGILISETKYRYQVEADIKPFRDMLLGLFFITIGMLLDLHAVFANLFWILLLLVVLVAGKAFLITLISRVSGSNPGVAIRTGLALSQAGEFGFVLLEQAGSLHLLGGHILQITLSAMLLSMLVAPFLIQHSERIVQLLYRGEWNDQALNLHRVMVKSSAVSGHAIVCGYGRTGQNLARFLEDDNVPFIALDFDPARVHAAGTAGENVVYGDAGRREILMAAGLRRAKAVVITFTDTKASLKILNLVRDLNPTLPVIVRTTDVTEMEKIQKAGATEVVPEQLEGSLMLASSTLMTLGVPLARVVKRIRHARESHYSQLRGYFFGTSDDTGEEAEQNLPRMVSVEIGPDDKGVGKTLAELKLEDFGVRVTAVRRHDIRGFDPAPETRLEASDVLVLLGPPDGLEAASVRLLKKKSALGLAK
ncbi:MAG: monovalent cation:proton antiporter-2 (CPA2) family protein [Sulfuricella sp.]|nr:monovalent cation:proton antiporter-2 (CPA2) family protein [Sulfuricella sp.]